MFEEEKNVRNRVEALLVATLQVQACDKTKNVRNRVDTFFFDKRNRVGALLAETLQVHA